MQFHKKTNNCLLSEHRWNLKPIILKRYNVVVAPIFMLISRIIDVLIGCSGTQVQGDTGVIAWGPRAASAESCTHPAKRDGCFPPPITERWRLPNMGIDIFAMFQIYL